MKALLAQGFSRLEEDKRPGRRVPIGYQFEAALPDLRHTDPLGLLLATQASYRRKVLATTGGKCAKCGSTDEVQAHHVHPLAEGGHRDGPGVPLCGRCHKQAHR